MKCVNFLTYKKFKYQLYLVTVTMLKTIKIKENTHKKLTSLGRKNESFDQLFNRLMKEVRNDVS